MADIRVTLEQISPYTTEASIRQHRVLIDRPEAKGGTDQGAMGGELLLAALGGCFMSNLLEAVRTREAAIHAIQTEVTGTLESNPSRFTAMHLHISAHYEDEALMQKLVTIAERACIAANTLRHAVTLTFSIGQRQAAPEA